MTDTNTPESSPAPKSPAARGLRPASRWEVYYPSSVAQEREAVLLASFPMILYFWPAMLTFLVCGALQGLTGISEVALGWTAFAVFAVNLIVIVQDLDQKKFAILILGLVSIGLLVYISKQQHLTYLNWVDSFFGSVDLRLSTHAYFLFGGMFALLFTIGMMQPLLDYWRFEPNEFVHYVQPWGRDQSVPRLGTTVTREIPDILEYLLTFGGGSIVIRRDNDVVAKIEHVPFLGRRMRIIERLLGATRVTAV